MTNDDLILQLSEKITALEKELVTTRQQCDNYEGENTCLKIEIKEKQKEIDELKNKLHSA